MTYEKISKMNNAQLAQLLKNAYALKLGGGPKAEEAGQVMKWIAEFVARRDSLLTDQQIAAAIGGILQRMP